MAKVFQGTEPAGVVRCDAFPGLTFPAKGGWLNQQTEALTGDVPVKLRVPNPESLLRVGMSVRVELTEPPVEGVANQPGLPRKPEPFSNTIRLS